MKPGDGAWESLTVLFVGPLVLFVGCVILAAIQTAWEWVRGKLK